MTFDYPNIKQGWVLIISSSILCLLGCLVIFVDDLYRLVFPRKFVKNHPFELRENYGFLIASLSFSSGCLLFTALYRLLPKSYDYLEDSSLGKSLVQGYLIGSFIFGLVVYFLLDLVLHLITSESVIHHNHDLEDGHSHSHGDYHGVHDDHHGIHDDHQGVHGNDEDIQETIEIDERSALIPKKKFSLMHIFGNESIGECKGYSSAEMCINDTKKLHYCELPIAIKADTNTLNSNEVHSIHSDNVGHYHSSDNDEEEDHTHSHAHHGHIPLIRNKSTHSVTSIKSDHHHHVATPLSRLLMIGIQTTLAITLHKLPEGFITFVTSEADSRLGIEIFLSLLVHNFIEGFSMCLPLYYSFSNTPTSRYPKLKSILIGGGLGSISQPLGGLLGLLFLNYSDYNLQDLNFVFGVTMAITSGFLTVVALSMFGSAIAFNGRSQNMVVTWTLIGMGVIGISLILSSS